MLSQKSSFPHFSLIFDIFVVRSALQDQAGRAGLRLARTLQALNEYNCRFHKCVFSQTVRAPAWKTHLAVPLWYWDTNGGGTMWQ